jgi:hypothetical protein
MFENVAIRIIVGIVVIILGFALLKFLNPDKESSLTEYAAPVKSMKPIVVKKPTKGILKKLEMYPPPAAKTVSWAPSPVDTTISEYGEWDTNRNPDSFITNIAAGFPENDEGRSAAHPTKWTPPAPTVPDVSTIGEFKSMGLPLPPVGYEDPFNGLTGTPDLDGMEL